MWLFTKEAAVGIVRTVMPFVWGWAVTQFPAVVDFAAGLGITQEGATVILGGVIYSLIRAIAEKIPQVGYLLVFNKKPAYDL